MEPNYIMDYEQVEFALLEITEKGIIKKEKNLATTAHGLPIEHYTVGTGKKDIVITGATHGSEIISTDFIVKLMNEITNEPNSWESILNEFTIHFIPMLNPEGYLITTSAVRKLIPREMSVSDAEKICKQYYLEYRKDTTEPLEDGSLKRHQKMFEGIDYTCIPDKYPLLKAHIKSIFEKYPDLPKWCLHTWSANGNGIDIQANTEYNPKIENINNNEDLYSAAKRYNNINYAHPGPINCPFDKEKGFELEIETQVITNLLKQLQEEDRLFAYFNYHGTGGIIYQRPVIPPEDLHLSSEYMSEKEITNYLFAKLYADKTYKNRGIDTDGIDKREKTKYGIQKGQDTVSSSNDVFRLLFPLDMLVELSGMGGNPIAPYGDIDGNYTNLIESNLAAVKYALNVGALGLAISKELYKRLELIGEVNADYELRNEIIDLIYKEFATQVANLEEESKKANTR